MFPTWFARCFLTLFLVTFAVGKPIGPTRPVRITEAQKQFTTGVAWRDQNGHVPVRREVRDLKDHFPDQWNLYLLGLRSFQLSDQNSPVSFYRIASIHGMPYRTWEGAEGIPDKVGKYSYCPHNNPLFFGWHRPYLALYEQELYKHIRNIALGAPSDQRERYGAAADSFRIPYWDWALGEKGGSVPDFFTQQMTEVTATNGSKQTIPNPLFTYNFNPLVPDDFDGKWSEISNTVRWPTSDATDASSQDNSFVKEYEKNRRAIADQVSQGFSRALSLNSFSENHIEFTHGTVHGIIGGNGKYTGHMWPVEYSAFDPIFMLHHANVDRLFALWQAVHPDLYMEHAKVYNRGNVFIADDSIVHGDTPLLPFWKDSDSFWTTNLVRDTATLGYAYPETQRWKYDSEQNYRAAVNATISQLYGLSARNRLSTYSQTGGDLHHLAEDGTFIDWTIRTQASPLDMPPTFEVRFSLKGETSSDPVTQAGLWTILMPIKHNGDKREARRIEKKQKRASTLEKTLKGSVSLTASLLDKITAGELEDLSEAAVVPYLSDKLTWKVFSGDGTVLLQSDIDGLTIEVMSTKVRIPDDANQGLEFSDEVNFHPEITMSKAGGVIHG